MLKQVQHDKSMKATKQNLPLVSVIMPVYNAGAYLVDAIESILNQTYTNLEFIIVDDCSTDNSSKILALYKQKYPKLIKVIRTPHNLNGGGDRCANEALNIAKGKYVARMDADDISQPTRLEKQVAMLEVNPDIFLVGSNATVIDRDNHIIGQKAEPLTSDAIYKAYFTFHPLIHPTVMLRRIMPNGKPFNYHIKYSANNDYYTFFSLICQGFQFANLEESLLLYRIHGKNDTFKKMKRKFMNTLKVRAEMVIRNNYKLTIKGVVMTTMQGAAIFLLPENITTYLYLVSKGIIKKEEIFSFLPSPQLALFKA